MDVGYRSRRRPRRAVRQRPEPTAPPTKLSHVRDRTLGEKWAAYLAAARERTGLTKAELAKAARVARATVFRWEAGESRPEQAEIVARVAEVLGVDLDEALGAAGLRPDPAVPDRPRRQELPLDKDALYLMRRLADPDVSPEEKQFIRATLQRAARMLQEAEEAEREAAAAAAARKRVLEKRLATFEEEERDRQVGS